MSYTNADGLYTLTFKDKGAIVPQGVTAESPRQAMVVDLTLAQVGTSFGASNVTPNLPFIPAGSVLVGATLVITAAATSAGTPTLTLGTYDATGTAIDADGIDAAIAFTAIDANGDVVRCDGAQVSGVLGYLTANAYIGPVASAAFTGGTAKLIVEYIKP
jgi:hypothetical protein